MASLQQAIEQALANARRAQAKAMANELPDLRDDPWFYLDVEQGEERLRRLMKQVSARRR
jgi:hypothetical protein